MSRVIVIGAGVNGLVAAHYLRRGGHQVLVLERQPDADSSPDIGWVPPPLVAELGLDANGLTVTRSDPWIAAALQDGGRLELSGDVAKTAEAIRRISPADAQRWPEFCARMRRLAGFLETLYTVPPPDVESRDLGELLRIGRLALRARRLGKQGLIDLLRILPMSVAALLDEWFESDALKGVLGAGGVLHLRQGPRAGGTAFNLLHHHVGSPAGVFRPPESNVSRVLDRLPGIDVRRGATVASVRVTDGRATGVALASGEEIP